MKNLYNLPLTLNESNYIKESTTHYDGVHIGWLVSVLDKMRENESESFRTILMDYDDYDESILANQFDFIDDEDEEGYGYCNIPTDLLTKEVCECLKEISSKS